MPDQHGNYTIYHGDSSITFAEHETPAFAPGLWNDLETARREIERLRTALDTIADCGGGWDKELAFDDCKRIAKAALQGND